MKRFMCGVVVLALAAAARAQSGGVVFGDALAVTGVAQGARIVIAPDAVAAKVVRGEWKAPAAGDVVVGGEGRERKWEAVEWDGAGPLNVRGVGSGYVFVPVSSDRERVVLLRARGTGMVYVNGEPRTGDPYDTGMVRVPVLLREGGNELLIRGGRGAIGLEFTEPAAKVYADEIDPTLPDVAEGYEGTLLAGVIVGNATGEWQRGVEVVASAGGAEMVGKVDALPPLSRMKVAVEFRVEKGMRPERLSVKVRGGGGEHSAEFPLRVRGKAESRKETFRSAIDRSVQYYAVREATGEHATAGMIFTLHGASVEATSQADAYASKEWAHVVAPTNRRPFGFDWEDWGRMDFEEVYAEAMGRFAHDPRRVYLTGHSMGGHGTWQVGAHFAGRFAAIAPSAGWISFWTYTGAAAYAGGTPIENMLRRAASPSDTLAMRDNYRGLGVYILHGDADDNVPVAQARQMRKELGEFHADFAYYERPGAGHWWGNECVDWPPLMEFLKARTLPERRERVAYTTMAPSVSESPIGWVAVEAQVEPFTPSTVEFAADVKAGTIKGKTGNVGRVAFDAAAAGVGGGEWATVTIDGEELRVPASARLVFAKGEDGWVVDQPPKGVRKTPSAGGPFREAFGNGVVLVVGTRGSAEENAWALGKARFDAEMFWYRGNGAMPVVLDTEYSAAEFAGRNVVLYGNRATNGAWEALLGESPVVVEPGAVTVGGKRVEGAGTACLFVRPGAGGTLVGVVGGSGVTGMRLAGRVPFFQSGVGLPDWIVIGEKALESGVAGVEGAGYFGEDWGVMESRSAWRGEKTE